MTQLNHDIAAYCEGSNIHFKENVYSQKWFANKVTSSFAKNECKVLDLGIGHGIITKALSEHFENYTVIDAEDNSNIVAGDFTTVRLFNNAVVTAYSYATIITYLITNKSQEQVIIKSDNVRSISFNKYYNNAESNFECND